MERRIGYCISKNNKYFSIGDLVYVDNTFSRLNGTICKVISVLESGDTPHNSICSVTREGGNTPSDYGYIRGSDVVVIVK